MFSQVSFAVFSLPLKILSFLSSQIFQKTDAMVLKRMIFFSLLFPTADMYTDFLGTEENYTSVKEGGNVVPNNFCKGTRDKKMIPVFFIFSAKDTPSWP